ncbi:MAG: IS3 family transposase [Thermoflexibacter sp.]|jgi:transposase InsO family protein|nr:IS3 family transposase [Thermoflexibacter sp.]
MTDLYALMNISKQAIQQAQQKQNSKQLIDFQIVEKIIKLRIQHPVMGLKKLYLLIKPQGIGRDKFLKIASKHGLRAKIPRSFKRTTFALKSARYTNLLAKKQFTDVNQVWCGDITYFQIFNKFYYLTFIMDIYSRKILGYSTSKTLQSEFTTLQALKNALKERKTYSYENKLIHHSDRGSQYVYESYTDLLEKYNIQISMCKTVLENAHAERLNGIIKNEYLSHWNISSFQELEKALDRAVQLYNEERPHQELDFKTPNQYEKELSQIPLEKREKLSIYTENTVENTNIQFVLF